MNPGLLRYPEGGKRPQFLVRWERSVAGTYNWLCPEGVSLARITCLGGGGSGGSGETTHGGAGGGAGGTAVAVVAVVALKLYTIVVGAGGVWVDAGGGVGDGVAGTDSSFDGAAVIGKGGSGGTRGQAGGVGVGGPGGSALGSLIYIGRTGQDGGLPTGGDGGSSTLGYGGLAVGPVQAEGLGAGGAGGTGNLAPGEDGTAGHVAIEF